ncbi:hypothetical protein B296_00025958 [Ensete ventricosum]|uniref:t-SNARE coiled-coil homology domain-containing protein n=1 Tax=Ensete ventricosum TaxID=4639 RepID=A0A426Z8T8_ENSVE|nr:hypothetical protein B296_00025958 [Ensete ventricosum]
MSPWKTPRSGNQQQHAKPGFSGSNPFDSVPDFDRFGDTDDKGRGTASGFSNAKARYKNDFRDSGGVENQSVQELQNYSAYKAEETTNKLNGCLKIAEEIREGASNTLVTLHHQGEQITRTHQAVADIEPDLSRIEKAKQDDVLSDLSNLLGELKNMAIDMGTEFEK